MIKDAAFWERWERKTQLPQPANFRRNLRLLEAMYEEARALGIMAVSPALEGLESRSEKSLERFEEVRQPPPKA